MRLHRFRGLALLLWLTGCASQPTLGGPQRYWHDRPATARGLSDAAGAGQDIVDVDIEALPPRQAEELLQRGVEVPRASQRTADPRTHRDFVDLRVTAVGFGITEGGYVLFCDGLPLPVLVPESLVDLGLTRAAPLNASIYPDRDAALADIAASVPASRRSGTYAYYRGAGGALIVPTLFSSATTPRIARTMLEVRKQLTDTVEREMKVMLVNLAGARVLQGVFSRVLRVGVEPELRPLPRNEGRGGEVPALRQPIPRSTETEVPASARAAEPSQPRPPRVAVPEQGNAGNSRASSQALREREAASEAPLPAFQQQIRDVLLEEHSGLHPRVATEAARGGKSVQGPGGDGADVTLLNGGGREVTVHHGEFTPDALGGHLVRKAGQDRTTEIYLQINSPGASREAFLQFIPKLRNAYGDLRAQFVRVFGPNGETWWSGYFGGPR